MDEFKARLLRRIAQATATEIARRSMETLRKMRHTMSGEDNGLKNTWQEICVQVQGDQSPFWDAYETAMTEAVGAALLEIDESALIAIWLETDEGDRWLDECDAQTDARFGDGPKGGSPDIADVPYSTWEVENLIIRNYLLKLAMNDEDQAVYRYLNPLDLPADPDDE